MCDITYVVIVSFGYKMAIHILYSKQLAWTYYFYLYIYVCLLSTGVVYSLELIFICLIIFYVKELQK